MFSKLPQSIQITEVGPRDGLQNEKKILSTEDKIKFILLLEEAGLKSIETTSFVRPDKVAQMSDAKELYEGLVALSSAGTNYPCLVPNLKGLEKAIEAGVKEIAIFTSTSEEFSQKNINASIDESFKRMEEVSLLALRNNLKIRGYISTVFGCPYEGNKGASKLLEVVKRLKDLGVFEISLGDTIGVATPIQTSKVIEQISSFDLNFFSMHFHDTRGMALANILTSLEFGITRFDASAGGLGGCPYAKGATGNVATEDVVYLCESLGIETNVNMKRLAAASEFILSRLGHKSSSKYLNAFLAGDKV